MDISKTFGSNFKIKESILYYYKNLANEDMDCPFFTGLNITYIIGYTLVYILAIIIDIIIAYIIAHIIGYIIAHTIAYIITYIISYISATHFVKIGHKM